MVRRAQALHRDLPHCRFVTNRQSHLRRFKDGEFDVVYSRLVLQHIPPRLLLRYIPELIRVTAPSGVLVFQLPSVIAPDSEEVFRNAAVAGYRLKRWMPQAIVSAYRAAKYRFLVDESTPRMLMFGMDSKSVASVVQNSGGRIEVIRPDQAHGTEVSGFEYWVSKSEV
jgi:SAM-dependent methyltransferase